MEFRRTHLERDLPQLGFQIPAPAKWRFWTLLGPQPRTDLEQLGTSWAGFALEQVLLAFGAPQPYFWATHGGAELDLLFLHGGKRLGFEFKFTEAPKLTAAMRSAKEALGLHQLIHPGAHRFPMEKGITALPLTGLQEAVTGS